MNEQTISAEQAEQIRAELTQFAAWLGKRTSYRAEDVPANVPQVSNERRADLELYEWHKDAPKRYFAYWTAREYIQKPLNFNCAAVGTCVTNWTGRTLGTIVSAGLVWRSNMGDKRRAFRMQGTNGVTYAGIAFLDAGTYVRLRAVRS